MELREGEPRSGAHDKMTEFKHMGGMFPTGKFQKGIQSDDKAQLRFMRTFIFETGDGVDTV